MKINQTKKYQIGFLRNLDDRDNCTSYINNINYRDYGPVMKNNFRYQCSNNPNPINRWLYVELILTKKKRLKKKELIHTLNLMNIAFFKKFSYINRDIVYKC